MLIVKLILYLYFILAVWLPKHKNNVSSSNKLSINYVFYYGLGIVLTALGYIFPFLERVGIPFYLFEGCFWGNILEITQSKDKRIYVLILGAIIMFYLYGDLFSGEQGQLPYYSVWENYY